MFAASFTLATVKAPILVYIVALILLVVIAYQIMRKKFGLSPTSILAFGLGDCLVIALINMRIGAPDMLIGESILIVFFIFLLFLLEKKR